MPEPTDLAAYLRVKRGVESFVRFHYPGELASLPEAEQRSYLTEEVRRIWNALQTARHKYQARGAQR
jgi:hypothetical protein